MTELANHLDALQDFNSARRRAALEQVMARLTGKPDRLLAYDEVAKKLKAGAQQVRGLQDIPLDAIVGSVGRYADFTRSFLPRRDSDQDRWTKVDMAMTELAGVPPIQVYQIGAAYFVLDGNHRVSVARQMGATHIQAEVIEVHTKVPLTPDVLPDDLIIKAEYADFLEHTRMDELRPQTLRPQADLNVSAPGQYPALEEHIQVHRYFMGLDFKRDISYPEAVGHWYDTVYSPIAQAIRRHNLLRDFPGRTETDLYLWLSEHHTALQKELGWHIAPEAAAPYLARQLSVQPRRVLERVAGKWLDALLPDPLEGGPPPGKWRQQRLAAYQQDRLFSEILVPVNGQASGWSALDQAVEIARRENSQLRGLYVVKTQAQADGDAAQAVRAEFERRCQTAQVPGELAIEVGPIARKIFERVRWVDLVVLSLAYAPLPRPIAKLRSGIHTLLRRCPTPVLAVPAYTARLERALLAFDGSPKAQEALFVATYLAARWQVSLSLLTVSDAAQGTDPALAHARDYLRTHGVEAAFTHARGHAAHAVLRTAREQGSDLILMGGYGLNPLLELALGSTVDHVLRESRQPILICR